MNIGVGECFFGPTWTWEQRQSWIELLAREGLSFFLYGPKADPYLRKRWREKWPKERIEEWRKLSELSRASGVQFGLAFSPFGLEPSETLLFQEKLECINDIGVNVLGIFFDDMNYVEGSLETHIEALKIAQEGSSTRLIYCPTFYSFDPILDKVFGQRPSGYLERVGELVPANIEICWTGPKVISLEISEAHLQEVGALLGRKPFLFDNFFANDGPKNCKFLKLRPYENHSPRLLSLTSGWMFNPMNQSALSQAMVVAAFRVMRNGIAPRRAMEEALEEIGSEQAARFLLENQETVLSFGLENIPDMQKSAWLRELASAKDAISEDVKDWIQGKYLVNSDCLTD